MRAKFWDNEGRGRVGLLELTDRFAEVDGVLQLLPQDPLARVPRHLQQEEAGVAFRKEVVRRVVLVHDLEKAKCLVLRFHSAQ